MKGQKDLKILKILKMWCKVMNMSVCNFTNPMNIFIDKVLNKIKQHHFKSVFE